MARDPRGTAEDSAAVPGQRDEPALAPDEGRDDTAHDDTDRGGATQADPAKTPGDPAQAGAKAAGPAAAAQERPQTATTAKPADHKIRHTRISGTWAAVVGFAVVLLLLLIFILQNQHSVDISYFGASGHLPLGVALLLAAVAGILLVALAGSARIMQLRATARRHRRAETKAAKAAQAEAKAKAKR